MKMNHACGDLSQNNTDQAHPPLTWFHIPSATSGLRCSHSEESILNEAFALAIPASSPLVFSLPTWAHLLSAALLGLEVGSDCQDLAPCGSFFVLAPPLAELDRVHCSLLPWTLYPGFQTLHSSFCAFPPASLWTPPHSDGLSFVSSGFSVSLIYSMVLFTFYY